MKHEREVRTITVATGGWVSTEILGRGIQQAKEHNVGLYL